MGTHGRTAPNPPKMRPLPSHKSQSGHFTSGVGSTALEAVTASSKALSSAEASLSSSVAKRTRELEGEVHLVVIQADDAGATEKACADCSRLKPRTVQESRDDFMVFVSVRRRRGNKRALMQGGNERFGMRKIGGRGDE